MDYHAKKTETDLAHFASILFLLLDENKCGCLNVLDVTHRSEQNKHRMWRQKFSQHFRHA